MEKIQGVDAVNVSLAKATADIRLKPGNTVTLAQLRQTIRQAGYPTRDAQIDARGVFTERNGTSALDLQNGTFLELAAKPPSRPAGTVEVAGTSRVTGKQREVLTVTPRR